ncbi:MAG: metallophosphatase family protein [Dehalococcoidia bacterium]|nr:metallophosphatase family protein [Dehalococcoidia bacterium]MDH4291431.1 metallophosphatase family protein [Dehalococcoidia bacterium]
MRIAVLGDTHVNKLECLPKRIIDALSTVDLIIHVGDFTDVQLLKELKQLREVKAVHGNMDSRQLKSVLPAKEIVETKNKRIGITHGSGGPWGIKERVRKVFESDRIDIIVYGHSHRSQNKVINDILFFNPGKAADSFGILTIDGEAKGEIISSR